MAGLINQSQYSANPADVQRVVISAKKILTQISPQILAMMKDAGDPVRAIAQATLFLMRQLYQKSQGSIPPQALAPAAQEVMTDIAKIGEAGGLFKATPQILQAAFKMAVQLFMQQEKVDPNEIRAKMGGPQQAPQAPAAPQAPQGVPQAPMGAI